MGQEEFNFEDSSIYMGQKCQLMDTLPATVLLNFLINRIDALPAEARDFFGWPRWLFKLLDIIGLINSFVELGYVLQLTMERFSSVSNGKFVGKLLKLLVQLYMMDTFGSLLRF